MLIYTCVNAVEASDGGPLSNCFTIPHKFLDADKPLHLVRKVKIKVAHMRVRGPIPDDNGGAEAREVDDRVGEKRHRYRVVRLQRLKGLCQFTCKRVDFWLCLSHSFLVVLEKVQILWH